MNHTDHAPAEQHYEVFPSKRSGRLIRVNCECGIGRHHSYEEWIDEGCPSVDGSTSGRPVVGVERRRPLVSGWR
jgi:hypothetical protein